MTEKRQTKPKTEMFIFTRNHMRNKWLDRYTHRRNEAVHENLRLSLQKEWRGNRVTNELTDMMPHNN